LLSLSLKTSRVITICYVIVGYDLILRSDVLFFDISTKRTKIPDS